MKRLIHFLFLKIIGAFILTILSKKPTVYLEYRLGPLEIKFRDGLFRKTLYLKDITISARVLDFRESFKFLDFDIDVNPNETGKRELNFLEELCLIPVKYFFASNIILGLEEAKKVIAQQLSSSETEESLKEKYSSSLISIDQLINKLKS